MDKYFPFIEYIDFQRFLIMCVSVSVWEYVHVSAGAQGGQKRSLDLLELEAQVVVSCPTWVLGTKLGPSERARSVLNHCAIPPVPCVDFYAVI